MKTIALLMTCLALGVFGCNRTKSTHQQREELLPPMEQAKISGNGSFYQAGYHARVYNGSTWNVTRVVVTVVGKKRGDYMADGYTPTYKRLWTKEFCGYPLGRIIRPLTTDTCVIELPDFCDGKDEPLTISQVYGFTR